MAQLVDLASHSVSEATGHCAAHQIARMVIKDFKELTADLYHLKCVTELLSHANRLRSQLEQMVNNSEDFEVVQMSDVPRAEFEQAAVHNTPAA